MNRKGIARRVGVAAGSRRCDDCRGPMKTAKRIEKGQAYCASCYHRQFERIACGSCRQMCIAKKHELVPRCKACTVRDRRCIRCARPVPQAGMMVGGEPVCPSCAPHYRAKKPCPLCGRMSSRLSRKDRAGEPICTPCAQKDTHATCAACRRHRAIGGVSEAGKLLCVSCALPGAMTHPCGGCGQATPGNGRALCHACAARQRGTVRMDREAVLLGKPWVRELFLDYCAICLLKEPEGDVTAHVDRASAFFVVIDRKIDDRASLTAASLLKALGSEELRRASKAVAFMSRQAGIEWLPGAKAEHADAERIEGIAAASDTHAWGRDLRDYLADLRDPERMPELKARTVRVYLRAAAGLLEHAGRDSASGIDAEHVAGFLRRKPGQRASLAPLLDWLERKREISIKLPSGRKKDSRAREKAMLARGAMLMARLEAATSAPEAKALLAAAISCLYRIPLETVLTLHARQVANQQPMILWPDGFALTPEPRLASLFRQWMPEFGGDMVFNSPTGPTALSHSAVAYHTRSKIKADEPTADPGVMNAPDGPGK